jgi:radical SAM protein with 4Fe4S-binding SPASM domain
MEEYRPCAGGNPTMIDSRYQEALKPAGLRYGIVEVTTRCQLACPGCYMVRRDSLNRGEMSLQQAIRALDLCRDYRGAELETMDLLGGEPLLWPHLQKFIEELLRRGIMPWIFTNMLVITPGLAKWLFEREVHITGKLNINPSDPSLYGLQGEMLGRNGKIVKQLLAAIKVFQKAGYSDPLFRLQNLIRRQNLPYVPDYYRWCLEQGIGTDLELMGSGEPIGPDYWKVAPTSQQLAAMIQKIQAVRGEFGLEEAEVLMPHVFGSCPFYDKGLYFAVDGHIRACSNSTVKLAQITDPDPIRKAYESPLVCNRLVLSQETVGEPCGSCSKWNQCRGGCRATVEGTGDPFGGYTLCPVPFLD